MRKKGSGGNQSIIGYETGIVGIEYKQLASILIRIKMKEKRKKRIFGVISLLSAE